jgi:phosphate transporter
MSDGEDFFGIRNPDEASVSRIRRLTSYDPHEVIRAISIVKPAPPSGPRRFWSVSFVPLISVVIFVVFYISPVFPASPTAHTCAAILIFGAFLWGSDIIPSYITAYLVPFMCVWFAIGYDSTTGERIPANKLAPQLASKFMDPIIFVFLGSLTMSAALCKLQITDRVSAFALTRINPTPNTLLMTIMVLNFSTAALLSNIASTTLLLTFSLPIIRSLEPNDPFIKALLFGLAWSGNTGGMVTPIASVQNILAIKYINESGAMSISFIEWMAFAGPTAILILIVQYVYVRFRFKTKVPIIEVDTRTDDFGPWTWRHTFAVAVTVITIILWAIHESFSTFFGHVGITALIPIIAFFSLKILNSEDFGHLRWSTLALMGGGIALGEAMNCSTLLDHLSSQLKLMMTGIDEWVVILIFLVIQALLVSVINHTSAAAILFPVLNALGRDLFGNPTSFLTLSALMIANAQLFHSSSFATALVSGVQKHVAGDPLNLVNEPFLPGPAFFIEGWPVVLASVVIIVSVGYGLVLALDA